MRRSRLLPCVVAVALSGALAGCGSLAKPVGGAAVDTSVSGGDDLTVGSFGSDGPLSPEGATAATGTGGLTSGGTTGVTAPGGATGTTGSSSGTSGGVGAGTTGGAVAKNAKPIKVGVTYPDIAALAAVFGVDSSEADAKTWINRIITYVNKTGGISGRQMVPVWYKADVSEDSSTSGQRACATFTQDNKVDIVVNTGVGGDTLPACLARVGISVIDTSLWATDTADMQRLRNRFLPNAIRADRMFTALVKLSAQNGLLPKGSKLGIIVEDCPWGNRIYDKLVPLAKQLGASVEKGTHRCVQNLVADLGPVTNDMQRETLRFASSGVTHVIFVSYAEAFVVSRFTNQASDQNYHPKYFITSNAYPWNDTRDGTINHAGDARPNMTGYGFNALMDVGPAARPETPGQKAAQDRCRTADPKEGIYAKDRGADGYWFSLNGIRLYCDAFFVLKAVLETNGVQFALADFTRGYQTALGGKLSSTVNSGGSFRVPKDGIDGIGLVRPFVWKGPNNKGGQFVYSGPSVAVP